MLNVILLGSHYEDRCVYTSRPRESPVYDTSRTIHFWIFKYSLKILKDWVRLGYKVFFLHINVVFEFGIQLITDFKEP